MQDPEIKATFDKAGIQVKEMDQQQFHQFVTNEMNKYAKIVKLAGIAQN